MTNKPITLDTDQLGTIIFDSTGKVTVEDVEYRTNHAIAFLSDQFVIRFSDQTVNYSYLNLGTEQLTKADITDLISSVNSLKTVIYSVSFIIFYLIQIGTSLVTVTVLALFGILLKGHVQLKYGQLWRMSAYAQTLATVFFMVMHSFNAIVPFGSFINWAVMIIMLYLAIKELRLSTLCNEKNQPKFLRTLIGSFLVYSHLSIIYSIKLFNLY